MTEPAPIQTANPPDDLVVADGLALATKQGVVFTGLSFAWPASRLAAVTGPSGSGRSALLLAVSGRMRGLTGRLSVGGIDAIAEARHVRSMTSVARISHLVRLEGQLTVRECITERALIDGVAPQDAERQVAALERTLGLDLPRTALVDELPALEETLLAVLLATVRASRLIVLDDAERRLPLADQRRLYVALGEICRTGPAVVLSTVEEDALPDDVPRLVLSRRPLPATAAATPTDKV